MKCDKCKKDIDENVGYYTIDSRRNIKYSSRVNGALETIDLDAEVRHDTICRPCISAIGGTKL